MEPAAYRGDKITIYEWPVGCEIYQVSSGITVEVRSLKDAKAIHESLGRYIETLEEEQ